MIYDIAFINFENLFLCEQYAKIAAAMPELHVYNLLAISTNQITLSLAHSLVDG